MSYGLSPLMPEENEPACTECGRPISPIDWDEGRNLCPFCEELEQEFQEMMAEELARESQQLMAQELRKQVEALKARANLLSE